MTSNLITQIENLAEDGWYHEANQKTFIRYAHWLTETYKMPEEHIIEMFEDLFNAVKDEYGD